MRVLHLSDATVFGGVETFLLVLARQGGPGAPLESSFALTGDGRLARDLRELGAPIRSLGAVRVRRPLSVRRARRELARLLEAAPPELVICHSPWAHALFGPVVRAAGLPLVFYLHGHVTGRHWLERLARRVAPDLVISNSRFTDSTAGNLFPGVAHEIVHYAVDAPGKPGAEVRREVRAELSTEEADVVMVQSCRMEPWKGHRLLLEGLARLDRAARWTAWIVGGAQRPHEVRYQEELRATAARLGIAGRVRFVGQRDDVPRILAAADIHCQPNLGAEPFGIAFVEALYAGLPVVTTALGGPKEIVDAHCGILVPPGDADALAGALQALIADGSRRRALGAAGPARAAELCEPVAQVDRLARALSRVVPDGAGG